LITIADAVDILKIFLSGFNCYKINVVNGIS
jgi:hypothetical protein